MYDPALGRFIQPDSIIPDPGSAKGFDRYAYVNNNPVNFNDPSGHCPWCLVGALVGAAAGYGIQVYDNYQNGYTGADAWTQNISAEPIIGMALLGATAVAVAPIVLAAAGDMLVGTGMVIGAKTAVGAAAATAGVASYQLSQAAADVIYPVSYPTLEIDPGIMPNIAKNVQNAQNNGAPDVLTRTTDASRIAANRAAATTGFNGIGSPDEYPFASTFEGGAGAFVSGVPVEEQWVQGGIISQFYRQNLIMSGDKFKVLVK